MKCFRCNYSSDNPHHLREHMEVVHNDSIHTVPNTHRYLFELDRTGFYEESDPLLGKAPKHVEAAEKAKFQKTYGHQHIPTIIKPSLPSYKLNLPTYWVTINDNKHITNLNLNQIPPFTESRSPYTIYSDEPSYVAFSAILTSSYGIVKIEIVSHHTEKGFLSNTTKRKANKYESTILQRNFPYSDNSDIGTIERQRFINDVDEILNQLKEKKYE